MSFGFSVGDCILLLQIARTQYKNCVSAGPEYTEIAREVKSLYSILKILRDEAEKPDSPLLRHDGKSTEELLGATEGCRHILEDLQTLLAKYEGLSGDGEAVSGTRKLWHKMRFGTKIQQLGDVRGKIITYTSTISVLLDAIQLNATGRLEDKVDAGFTNVGDKVDAGFANVMDGFLSMKKAIVEEVLKAKSQPKGRSTISLLSLSTYNDDNKEVWQEFRRELVVKGFNSRKLDRYRDVLMAYILKLEQNGVLEKLVPQASEQVPWWTKHTFLETTQTLLAPSLQPIVEETKHLPELDSAANTEIPLQKINATRLGENLFPIRGGSRSAPKAAAAGIVGVAMTQLYETRRGRDIRGTGEGTAAKVGLYDVQRTEKERFAEATYRNFPGLAHGQGTLYAGTPADMKNLLKESQQEMSGQNTPSLPVPSAVWPAHEDPIRAHLMAKTIMEKRLQEKKKEKEPALSLEEANTELSQGDAIVAQPIEPTIIEFPPGRFTINEQNPIKISQNLLEENIDTAPPEISVSTFKERGSSMISPDLNRFAYAESVAESEDDSKASVTGNDRLPLDQPKSIIEEIESQNPSESKKSRLDTRIESSKDTEDVSYRQRISTSRQPNFKPRKEAHTNYTSKSVPDISPPRSPKVRFKLVDTPAVVGSSRGGRKSTTSRVPRVVHFIDSEDSTSDEKLKHEATLKQEARTRQAKTFAKSHTSQSREERRARRKERENAAVAGSGPSYRSPHDRSEKGNSLPGREDNLRTTARNTQALQAVKAGVVAAAVEAFRVRNEPGGWAGERRKRILTAALGGAAAISTTLSNENNDEERYESKGKSKLYPRYEDESYYSEYTDTASSAYSDTMYR